MRGAAALSNRDSSSRVQWETLINLRRERSKEFASTALSELVGWSGQDAAMKRRDDRLRILFLSPPAAPALFSDKADDKQSAASASAAGLSLAPAAASEIKVPPKAQPLLFSAQEREELLNPFAGCVDAFANENAHLFTAQFSAAANIPNVRACWQTGVSNRSECRRFWWAARKLGRLLMVSQQLSTNKRERCRCFHDSARP